MALKQKPRPAGRRLMKFDVAELSEPVPTPTPAEAAEPEGAPPPTTAREAEPAASPPPERPVDPPPAAPQAVAPPPREEEPAAAEPAPAASTQPAPPPPQRQIPLQGVDPPPRRRTPRQQPAENADAGWRKGMKTRFTREETEANAEVLDLIKSVTQANISEAQVTRALWSLLRRADETIEQTRSRAPSLRRPSNGDSVAMAAFEDQIADYLHTVVRATKRGDR